jgi:N-acetylmuramoyl-L-alanine amidase
VVTRDNVDYVGLFEVLEPLGAVTAKLEGKRWKVHFGDREGQFVAGKSDARIQKTEMDLRSPFLVENGRGLVPVRMLPQLLGQFCPGRPLSWHEPSRRLFLDQAEIHYNAEIKSGTTEQLVIAFSSPVNPAVSTEAGKMQLVFRHEALLPSGSSQVQSFDDKTIPSLAYSEDNGTAQLTIKGAVPLIAYFSGDRRTVTIAPVAPAAASAPTGVAGEPSTGGPVAASVVVQPPAPHARSFLVVIDAAHGGEDRGAALTPEIPEKEVALAFARRLHGELQARGIPSRLLRDNDASLTTEQRAAAANLAAPSLYLSVHATNSSAGVHLFTSSVPAAKPSLFLPWDSAQGAYVEASRVVANMLATELLKRDIPALNRSGQVAPLNNIAAPALAIELAPPAPGALAQLQSGTYQLSICSAVAGVVAAVRSQLPHGGEAAR